MAKVEIVNLTKKYDKTIALDNLSIITFIDSWNSFFIPLIIIQSPDKMTLPLFLNNIGASQNADYGAFMLALFLSTIPAMILFAISQRYFKMGMKGM